MERLLAQVRPGWAEGLPESLDQTSLGLAWWQWISLAAVVLCAVVIGLAVRIALARITRLRSRAETGQVSLRSVKSLGRSVVAMAGSLAAQVMMPTAGLPLEGLLGSALLALQAVSAAWLAASLWEVGCDLYVHRASEVSRRTATILVPFAKVFGRAVAWIAGGVAAFAMLGYNVGALLAGLGIGGVAVALAAKDSVENFFGALTIVLDMPFGVGDWVKIGDVEGAVEDIGLRSTRIRTLGDSLVTLPNSNLIKASVENMGLRRVRRIQASFPLWRGTPPESVAAFADEFRRRVRSKPNLVEEKSHIFVQEAGPGGIVVQASCFFDLGSYAAEVAERERLVLDALAAAREVGVHIGDPVPTGGA